VLNIDGESFDIHSIFSSSTM